MSTEQLQAPLYQAMRSYAEDGAFAFHTPGHKQGRGAHPFLQELITAEGLRTEVSLMEELDDLHAPNGCIREAETLAAQLYGADRAFFCVNGTTGAIHAMLLGTLLPGDSVFLPRNAHRSLVGAVVLAGLRPIYLQPEIDPELGIAHGITAQTLASGIADHPEAKAAVLVYPTYYGACADLSTLSEIAHRAGLLVLVDEAHGAHLRFSEELPSQALDLGADAAAQSTHKLLGAMTQSSMLLVRKERIDIARVQAAMSLLQSTSPNYLLMASLDIARLQIAEQGAELLARAVRLAEHLRTGANAISGLFAFGAERIGRYGIFALDRTKVTISVSDLGISGKEAEIFLRRQKIQCELADACNVLFLITIADTEQEVEFLLDALRALSDTFRPQSRKASDLAVGRLPAIPPLRLLPRAAFFAAHEPLPFEESIGMISAEQIIFYPPGIPILCPGEEITEEIVHYIRAMQKLGLKLIGPQDQNLETILCCKKNPLGLD